MTGNDLAVRFKQVLNDLVAIDQMLLQAKLVPADEQMWDDGPRLLAWTHAYLEAYARAVPAELRDALNEARKARQYIKSGKDRERRVLAFLKRLKPGSPCPELRGRPKGSGAKLVAANSDVDRIQRLWRLTFNKKNRFVPPTAISIAAARHGVAEQALATYRKNQGPTTFSF